jgi:hypothetical protein
MGQTFQELIEPTEIFLARKVGGKGQLGMVNLTLIWQTEQHEKVNTLLPRLSASIFTDGP